MKILIYADGMHGSNAFTSRVSYREEDVRLNSFARFNAARALSRQTLTRGEHDGVPQTPRRSSAASRARLERTLSTSLRVTSGNYGVSLLNRNQLRR